MSDISEIIQAISKFRDARDWSKFHNSKDLAIAINSEASELLDLFLWKSADECNVEQLKEELADVLIFCFYLADKHRLDVKEIILDKLKANMSKYPVDKSRGNAKKYTDL
jgi:NTP pyrophosphatase (non-canonical NTP hydrolase)